MRIERGDISYVRIPKKVQKCNMCGCDAIENQWGEFICESCGTVLDKSHIQTGVRPAIIWSNNSNNKYSPTVNVIPLTAKIKKDELPVHAILRNTNTPKLSMALTEQLTTVDKYNILEKVGHVSEIDMISVEFASMIQQGLLANIDKLAILAQNMNYKLAI